MSGRPGVLVVEDDVDIAGVLRRSLDKEGYEVRIAADGEERRSTRPALFEPDAVVLDLGLPKLDGVEVCRQLRQDGDVPILILTAATPSTLESRASTRAPTTISSSRSSVTSCWRVCAPCCGAARRAGAHTSCRRPAPQLGQVFRGERQLDLTAREFELLEYLMRNARIVVSRQTLLDEVWGYHPFAETNTVDVFISNLRRKLEDGGEPRMLHTMRGAGYVLRDEQ